MASAAGEPVGEPGPVAPAPDVLDLVNMQLADLSGIDVVPSLTDVDLTGNRLKEWDPRLCALPDLQKISVRKNLLTTFAPLLQLPNPGALQELMVDDNQIEELPALSTFSGLHKLDVSYNEIRSVAGLRDLAGSSLIEFYAASNKVKAMEGVEGLARLTVLEMGSNRLRTIEGLDELRDLKDLWLGRNKIAAITGLAQLQNLVRLSVQSNRLTGLTGLEACTGLEELYLSHNGIVRMEGLATLQLLRVLDLSANQIEVIDGLEALPALTDLWFSNNKLASLDGLSEALHSQKNTLTTIYLEGNPAAQDPAYKTKVLAILPKLTQLDANAVVLR